MDKHAAHRARPAIRVQSCSNALNGNDGCSTDGKLFVRLGGVDERVRVGEQSQVVQHLRYVVVCEHRELPDATWEENLREGVVRHPRVGRMQPRFSLSEFGRASRRRLYKVGNVQACEWDTYRREEGVPRTSARRKTTGMYHEVSLSKRAVTPYCNSCAAAAGMIR
jgi:hypothetical protein